MRIDVIDVILAVVVAGFGIGLGWLLRGVLSRRPARTSRDQAVTHEILTKLRELADDMAANVDEHSCRVREIGDEVHRSDDPRTVVAAVAKIIQANGQMQQQLDSAEEKLHEQAVQLEFRSQEARTDSLTGLANRRVFDDEITRAHAEFQARSRATTTLLLLDIDHFKKLNDTHGHQAGDEVLRGVAKVLRKSFGVRDIVARFGGEEFAVILCGVPLEQARAKAERARADIGAATYHHEGVTLRVTACAGLAELLPAESIAGQIRRADEALYKSKDAGRNCGHWHDGQTCFLLTDDPPQTTAAGRKPVRQSPTQRDGQDRSAGGSLDPVTRVSNRSAFNEHLNRRVAEWKRGGPRITMMLIRVDDFDDLVRERGQASGEIALRATAQFLRAALRNIDHIARYDSDTFAILLPAVTLLDAVVIADRMRRAIKTCRLSAGNQSLQFTASVGVAAVRDSESSRSLVSHARVALDAAIDAGRDACYFFDHDSAGPTEFRRAAMSAR